MSYRTTEYIYRRNTAAVLGTSAHLGEEMPQRRLKQKKRIVLAVLIVILEIYQRQRILQHRARGHEEQTSIYGPPIAYIQRHGWTTKNFGDQFFHNERNFIESYCMWVAT